MDQYLHIKMKQLNLVEKNNLNLDNNMINISESNLEHQMQKIDHDDNRQSSNEIHHDKFNYPKRLYYPKKLINLAARGMSEESKEMIKTCDRLLAIENFRSLNN